MSCKHDIILEGDRLAKLYDEEAATHLIERNRLKILLNTLQQAGNMFEIFELNRLDELSLMEKHELELVAAAQNDLEDDVMIRTVNGLGEKYLPNMFPKNDAVAKIEDSLSLAHERATATHHFRSLYLNSENDMLEVVKVKSFSHVRQTRLSWTDHSDLERAQQLQSFMINWMQVRVLRLSELEKNVLRNNSELRLEMAALRHQNLVNLGNHSKECEQVRLTSVGIIQTLQMRLTNQCSKFDEIKSSLDGTILELSKECQQLREKSIEDIKNYEEEIKLLRVIIRCLEYDLTHTSKRLEVVSEEKRILDLSYRVKFDELKTELRRERKHSSVLYFIIHTLRASIHDMKRDILRLKEMHVIALDVYKLQNRKLNKKVYQHLYCFSHMSSDVKSLFGFFVSRLANLAGTRRFINRALVENCAADVLAVLCKNPSRMVRKYATQALAGLGWDGYVESRVIMWDCVCYWNQFVASLKLDQSSAFEEGFKAYAEKNKLEIIGPFGNDAIFDAVPPKDGSLRTLLAERRQWALRLSRRKETPNFELQVLLGKDPGIFQSLLTHSLLHNDSDWEVKRNSALIIAIASFNDESRVFLAGVPGLFKELITLCTHRFDAEVNCYAATAISNMAYNHETNQKELGSEGCIEALIGLCDSKVVDVLESVTSAIANLTSLCDDNCRRLLDMGGIQLVMKIVERVHSENILDLDQNDEVQVNSIEILTNASRFECDSIMMSFDEGIVRSLCILAASPNIFVKRQVALIFGNIAQNEYCREMICICGGVEALMLVLEEKDSSLQSNALWALSNLMWFAPNQERAGRYLPMILDFIQSPISHIKTNAFLLLANSLYYCEGNCDRFLSIEGSLELLSDLVCNDSDDFVVESCLRCILSITCNDDASLSLGSSDRIVSKLLRLADPTHRSIGISKLSLSILCNLCVHDICRRRIVENQGLESLIGFLAHKDKEVSELADRIVDRLKEIAPPEALARMKAAVEMENLIQLVLSSDPLVRQAACENIGDRLAIDSDLHAFVGFGGVKVLLQLCREHIDQVITLIPSIWCLKLAIKSNQKAQQQFGEHDGINTLVLVLQSCLVNSFDDYSPQVLEAALSCLFSAVVEHQQNARHLVYNAKGLESLLQISGAQLTGNQKPQSLLKPSSTMTSLSTAILDTIGKHNYVVCNHCLKKQDVSGNSCISCGHRLVFEVMDSSKQLRKNKNKSLNVSVAKQSSALRKAEI